MVIAEPLMKPAMAGATHHDGRLRLAKKAYLDHAVFLCTLPGMKSTKIPNRTRPINMAMIPVQLQKKTHVNHHALALWCAFHTDL